MAPLIGAVQSVQRKRPNGHLMSELNSKIDKILEELESMRMEAKFWRLRFKDLDHGQRNLGDELRDIRLGKVNLSKMLKWNSKL